jgi:hypothetical protein
MKINKRDYATLQLGTAASNELYLVVGGSWWQFASQVRVNKTFIVAGNIFKLKFQPAVFNKNLVHVQIKNII